MEWLLGAGLLACLYGFGRLLIWFLKEPYE